MSVFREGFDYLYKLLVKPVVEFATDVSDRIKGSKVLRFKYFQRTRRRWLRFAYLKAKSSRSQTNESSDTFFSLDSMSGSADPPPSYTESVRQQQAFINSGMQQSYGSVPSTIPPPSGSTYVSYPGYPQPQPPNSPYGLKPGPYHLHQPAGYPASSAGSSSYQGSVVVNQYPTQQVVLVGGCPACRVGILEDDFTCMGVFCAILFFPLGILCCLAMRQRRCAHCGAVFG